MITPSLRRHIQLRLRRWFDRHARDLPWRHNRDPYRIWVSEVMLQQTQVAAVSVHYQRFLNEFPTLADLARADEQQVLRCWQGLGYYRRARNLHQAARLLATKHGSQVPHDPGTFAALPGIGRYTLGAVLSQAFDLALPIVEANSMRVLCRLFGYHKDPRSSAGQRLLWDTASDLLPDRRVGDHNQALMELGAIICTPRKPNCAQCPLTGVCIANKRGWVAQIPKPQRKERVTVVSESALALRRGNRILLAQRSEGGRWAGMWEFPRHESPWTPLTCRERIGVEVKDVQSLGIIRHRVTRFDMHVECFAAGHVRGKPSMISYQKLQWVPCKELDRYPCGSAQRRMQNLVLTEMETRS